MKHKPCTISKAGVVRRHKFPRAFELELFFDLCLCVELSARADSLHLLLPHNLVVSVSCIVKYICQASRAILAGSRCGRNSSLPELWFSPPSEEFLVPSSHCLWSLLGCLLVHCLQQLLDLCAFDAPPNASGYPSRSIEGNLCSVQTISVVF